MAWEMSLSIFPAMSHDLPLVHLRGAREMNNHSLLQRRILSLLTYSSLSHSIKFRQSGSGSAVVSQEARWPENIPHSPRWSKNTCCSQQCLSQNSTFPADAICVSLLSMWPERGFCQLKVSCYKASSRHPSVSLNT